MNFITDNIAIILLLSSLAHIFEEFVYPGGFADEFRAMVSFLKLSAGSSWFLLTNILFILAVSGTFIFTNEYYVLAVCGIILINGILHTIQSIKRKRYFPGIITSLAFYLPLGIVSYTIIKLNVYDKALCLLMGLALHAFPLLLLYSENKIKTLKQKPGST